jgi:hypothetical protein
MPYADAGKREAYNQEYRGDVIIINMRKLRLDAQGKSVLREIISRAIDQAIADQKWRSWNTAVRVLKPEKETGKGDGRRLGRKGVKP